MSAELRTHDQNTSQKLPIGRDTTCSWNQSQGQDQRPFSLSLSLPGVRCAGLTPVQHSSWTYPLPPPPKPQPPPPLRSACISCAPHIDFNGTPHDLTDGKEHTHQSQLLDPSLQQRHVRVGIFVVQQVWRLRSSLVPSSPCGLSYLAGRQTEGPGVDEARC